MRALKEKEGDERDGGGVKKKGRQTKEERENLESSLSFFLS